MSAPISRYEAVKQHVLDGITNGAYEAGDKLPSENELVRELDVSRMTVNRALRELTEEGHIIRRAGMGSFVASRRMRGQAVDIESIRDELARRDEFWSATVLQQCKIKASENFATEFGVEAGSTLYYLLIVHKGDGVPIELEERWVNPEIAPDFLDNDFTKLTPTEYLLANAPLLRAEHVVRAVAPSIKEAEFLGVSDITPCLEINRRTWTGEKVASFARLIYPGHRYELSARFSNVGASV